MYITPTDFGAAAPGVQGVIASAPAERVTSGTAAQNVGSSTPIEDVSAAEAAQDVRSRSADEDVWARRAGQRAGAPGGFGSRWRGAQQRRYEHGKDDDESRHESVLP